MKKICIFISLLSVNFTFSQIQSEDFEETSIPISWTTNVVSGGVDWMFGASTTGQVWGSFTTNAAFFNDDAAGETELNNTAELLSPAINLTSYSDINLSFDYLIEDYAGAGYFTAEVWNGSSWVEILNVTEDTNPTTFNLDVTAYANPSFQVKFTYGDDQSWAYGAGVDKFILSGTLSNSEFAQSKITVFPIPTADFININTTTTLSNITIVDMNGKLVQKIQNGTTKVDLSHLSAGTYLLTYDIDGKHYLNKIVRK